MEKNNLQEQYKPHKKLCYLYIISYISNCVCVYIYKHTASHILQYLLSSQVFYYVQLFTQ